MTLKDETMKLGELIKREYLEKHLDREIAFALFVFEKEGEDDQGGAYGTSALCCNLAYESVINMVGARIMEMKLGAGIDDDIIRGHA